MLDRRTAGARIVASRKKLLTSRRKPTRRSLGRRARCPRAVLPSPFRLSSRIKYWLPASREEEEDLTFASSRCSAGVSLLRRGATCSVVLCALFVSSRGAFLGTFPPQPTGWGRPLRNRFCWWRNGTARRLSPRSFDLAFTLALAAASPLPLVHRAYLCNLLYRSSAQCRFVPLFSFREVCY